MPMLDRSMIDVEMALLDAKATIVILPVRYLTASRAVSLYLVPKNKAVRPQGIAH